MLAGGLGADILEGGLGDDTYVLSDDKDTIIDTGGIDTIRSVLDIELVVGIEDAELAGILKANATGTAADNVLIGNLGNNTLDGKEAWIFYMEVWARIALSYLITAMGQG